MTSIASIITMLIGLITSISMSLTGAGGGMMILFALIFILKFSLHKAIGTSILIMAITALSGATGYGSHGEIDIIAGIVVGIGARLANTFSEQTLARVAGGFFVTLGIIMTFILVNGNTPFS